MFTTFLKKLFCMQALVAKEVQEVKGGGGEGLALPV